METTSLAMINIRGLKPPIKAVERNAISLEIERIKKHTQDATYIESFIEFADQFEYDIEDVPKMVSKTLLGKVESEAYANNLLRHKRDTSTLDKWLS